MTTIDHRIRHKALRLWGKHVPRKLIAELCGVSEDTIRSWRAYYCWPARKGKTALPPAKKVVAITGATTYGCPTCGLRASDPKGHPICQEVA